MNNCDLMMSKVEFPESVDWREYHSYVANVFWRQKIGKVSKVSVMPYSKNEKLWYVCLVRIKEWFDSECAYNFIKRLKDASRETRLVYSEDNWWVVECNNEMSYKEIYTVNFKEAEYEFEENDVLHYVSDDDELSEDYDELSDDELPPSLERGGNYWCSLCGEGPGGMYSICNNENCEWYKKSILDIAFGDKKASVMSSKKSVSYDDVPPTIIPAESWLNDLINDDLISLEDYDKYDDVAPSVIPPASWLNGLDFEDDEQEEWVKISSIVNENIPEFEDTKKYICGFCGESRRGVFSICWNMSCERYSKSIVDIYEESFNYKKEMENVTLRKHQKAYMW